MHDPKFEKEVQQKMEELSFNPSEAVWENVEKKIRKDKKRRVPFLWFFLLAGIMLAGGYYMTREMRSSPSLSTQRSGTQPLSAPADLAGKDNSVKKDISGPLPATQSIAPAEFPSNASANIPSNRASDIPSKTTSNTSSKAADISSKQNDISSTENAVSSKQTARVKLSSKITGRGHKALDGAGGEQEPQQSLSDAQQSLPDTQSSVKKDIPKSAGQGDAAASLVKAIPPAAKENISNPDKKIAGQNKSKITHPWKIGLTAGSGISAMDRSLFKPSTAAERSTFASTFAAYPPGWQIVPSTIRQDISFAAGIFGVRPLTRKISFSIGLSYHYYSTTIQTGGPISPLPAGNYNAYSLALLRPTNANLQTSTPAYGKGNEDIQKEQYHSLELPVSIQWQFTRIRKLPVYWETGFSISSLIGINSLSFDGTSGAYYKEGNFLFRKTQMSVSTAIMFGLPFAGNHLQLGPQIQYGLTDLLKNNIGNAQHLLFAGIKLAFIMGK